jgi:hypothetical protein
VNQPRITAIAAGSPATAEEARELAQLALWRPMETAPVGKDIRMVFEGWIDTDNIAWVDGWDLDAKPIGWLPLPAAPEVGK